MRRTRLRECLKPLVLLQFSCWLSGKSISKPIERAASQNARMSLLRSAAYEPINKILFCGFSDGLKLSKVEAGGWKEFFGVFGVFALVKRIEKVKLVEKFDGCRSLLLRRSGLPSCSTPSIWNVL